LYLNDYDTFNLYYTKYLKQTCPLFNLDENNSQILGKKYNKSSLNRFLTQESTPLVVSELCPLKDSKCNNSKIRQGRVTVLCTALLINVIYQPTKFLVDISYCFRVMSQTTSKSKNKHRAITPELGKAEL
jgi:hypothetical protein